MVKNFFVCVCLLCFANGAFALNKQDFLMFSAQDSIQGSSAHLTKDKNGIVYYMRDGVSFTVSPEWTIIYDKQIAKDAYYFSMETNSKTSTGLVTVAWLDYYMDLTMTLNTHKKHIAENKSNRSGDVLFSEERESTLNGHKSMECHYKVISKDGQVYGKIVVFNIGIKTITLFYETQQDDKDVNDLLLRDFVLSFGARED